MKPVTWEELEEAACRCAACPLGMTKKNTVFGTGNRDAELMFIGEAPGEREDETGIPFVGAAGQLFDKYLTAVGISRDEVYIANILKCRPPHNRDPQETEIGHCMGLLRGQVKLVRPRIIVCLGRIAAEQIIHREFRITREHGVFVRKGNFLMTAVYHPSALLRDASRKADMLVDMKAIAHEYRNPSFTNE